VGGVVANANSLGLVLLRLRGCVFQQTRCNSVAGLQADPLRIIPDGFDEVAVAGTLAIVN
jgi:hypothetical protein